MGVSAISGTTAAQGTNVKSGSLEAAKTSIEAKIFDISTCTTTPPQIKATQLANLNQRKATIETQIKALEKKPDPVVPTLRDGSTIHVVA